nr:hypothetical protein [Tanacetum cinerariifolium]
HEMQHLEELVTTTSKLRLFEHEHVVMNRTMLE